MLVCVKMILKRKKKIHKSESYSSSPTVHPTSDPQTRKWGTNNRQMQEKPQLQLLMKLINMHIQALGDISCSVLCFQMLLQRGPPCKKHLLRWILALLGGGGVRLRQSLGFLIREQKREPFKWAFYWHNTRWLLPFGFSHFHCYFLSSLHFLSSKKLFFFTKWTK